MNVKGGIARAAHAVAESHPNESLAALDPVPAFAALDETGFMLKVREALTYRVVDDVENAGAGCLIA